MQFYKCSICSMYHKVGFDPKRDMEKVWKEHEILGRILIEPPQFVWSQLPSDAKIVREPSQAANP